MNRPPDYLVATAIGELAREMAREGKVPSGG